ncbi:MAG TPA: ATP-binding protein [Burkholderiales bacterium]|nr:ATP-binding protein [Burkholderiales bacterium]
MTPAPRRDWAYLDFAMIGGALLPLVIFALVAFFTFERAQDDARADVRTRVEMLRAHVMKLIQVNVLLLERLQERFDPLESRAIAARQVEHHRYLSSLRARHPEVLSIAVIGPEGAPLAHSHQFPVPKTASAADRDYFTNQRERSSGLFVSAPLVSRMVNEAGFVLSLRRARADGTFDGIYTASIRSSYLSEFWEDIALHGGVEETVSLVRSDGTVLARFPQPVDGANPRLPPDNPLVAFMASGRGSGLWQAKWGMDGHERIAASRKIDGVPLYVNYAITTHSAFAAWRRDMTLMGGVATAATLLLLWLALLVRRRSSSLRQANSALEEAQSRFRTVADAAPVMLWITGSQGPVFVNRPALEFVGVRESEMPGFKFGRLIHRKDRETFLKAYDEAFVNSAPFDAMCRFKRADGEYRWMRSLGEPRFEAGAMSGYVGASFDVQELVEAQDSLREADKKKDEFLAALSHELRNPLSAITLSTEVLARAQIKDPQARSALHIISRQLGQLQRLVDDLLDTARATYDKLVLARHPVELLNVARNVVGTHGQMHSDHRRITAEGEPVWVNADVARLQQILANLIDNAVKYGGLNIIVRVRANGDSAELSVIDDGEGIAPELLPRLFQPFAQGAQTLERARGGLGLGLALVSRLATLHGGSIEAKSEGRGKGSTFTLRLPRGSAPAGGIAVPSALQRVPPRRVLIIEDQQDARESLKMLLELDGHDVAIARDGAEGLAKLASMDPDAALVDIGLPGIDGYEVARRARELPKRKNILMIALSGYAQKEDRERSRDAGFDLHLAKPVAYDDLRQALSKPPLAIAAVRS